MYLALTKSFHTLDDVKLESTILYATLLGPDLFLYTILDKTHDPSFFKVASSPTLLIYIP